MCLYRTCPRKYYWSRVQRLERGSVGRDLALRMGKAIHAAAPYTHRGQDPDAAYAAFDHEWLDGDDYGDAKRTRATGNAVIAEMCRVHRGGCPYEPVKPAEVGLATGDAGRLNEVVFDVDLGLPSGKPVNGVIDCVGRVADTNALAVVEYKTATQMWGSFGELFALSPQVYTYALAAQMLGVPVTVAYVEGILIAKTKATVTPYPVELQDHILESTVRWWRLQDESLAVRESLDADGTRPEMWDMDTCGCNPYACYGCQGWECEFDPLCSAGQNWQGLVDMYTVKKDDREEGSVEA